MSNTRMSFRVAALFLVGVAQGSGSWAGSVSGVGYAITYDDALGTPMVTRSGGIATYVFPSFDWLVEGTPLNPVSAYGREEDFAVALDTVQGQAFHGKVGGAFPVWAMVSLSNFSAYPVISENPPFILERSDGGIESHARVAADGMTLSNFSAAVLDMTLPAEQSFENRVLSGSFSTRARVDLSAGMYANSAVVCWDWDMSSMGSLGCLRYRASDLHVQGTFTPTLFVDERNVSAVVPEPSSLALLLAGLGLFGLTASPELRKRVRGSGPQLWAGLPPAAGQPARIHASLRIRPSHAAAMPQHAAEPALRHKAVRLTR